MAVTADSELYGSIGGGVMEVSLVEQAKAVMSEPGTVVTGFLIEQVHQKDVPNSSGMICAGKQTVIFKLLRPQDADLVDSIVLAQGDRHPEMLFITPNELGLRRHETGTPNFRFQKLDDDEFTYLESLGFKNHLYIVGGGHCALALSELMSKLDFRISQEVPFFLGGKVQLFADMENFLNMLNSDWGALRQVAFPYRASLVDVTCLQANGAAVTTAGQACARYQYSNFREPGLTTYTNYSIWQVRLGIRLDFKGL